MSAQHVDRDTSSGVDWDKVQDLFQDLREGSRSTWDVQIKLRCGHDFATAYQAIALLVADSTISPFDKESETL